LLTRSWEHHRLLGVGQIGGAQAPATRRRSECILPRRGSSAPRATRPRTRCNAQGRSAPAPYAALYPEGDPQIGTWEKFIRFGGLGAGRCANAALGGWFPRELLKGRTRRGGFARGSAWSPPGAFAFPGGEGDERSNLNGEDRGHLEEPRPAGRGRAQVGGLRGAEGEIAGSGGCHGPIHGGRTGHGDQHSSFVHASGRSQHGFALTIVPSLSSYPTIRPPETRILGGPRSRRSE
jgi:hypothetical protein